MPASRRPARGRGLPIVVIGNIGVIGIEGLLASMQSIGLDFYEFFTKFYKGGARSLSGPSTSLMEMLGSTPSRADFMQFLSHGKAGLSEVLLGAQR